MAKKARTPAPPRPVQAPQRRDGSRGGAKAAHQRRPRPTLWYAAAAAAALVVAAIVAGVLLTRGNGGSKSSAGSGKLGPAVSLNGLPGMRHTKGPWNPGYAGLPDRLSPLGLTALPQEALKQHVHQHLDIYIDGKHVVPPSGIGVYDGDFLTEIHSHGASAEGLRGPPTRATGVIHVESPTAQTYGLGQYFGAWGVYLSRSCIGGWCAKPGTPLRFYVNGKLWREDPLRIPLTEREEIAIVYGKPPAKIPSTFAWTSSL
jgi:hypothetical protein